MQRFYIENVFRDGTEEEKVAAAFHLLNIDEKNFSRIQTRELKEEALQYKYCRREIEMIGMRRELDAETVKQLNLLEQAYTALLKSQHITQHKSVYSKHSVGLNELRMRTTYDSGTPEEVKAELEKSIIQVGDVNSGVEPKFKAILARDPILYVARKFPNKELRWQFILEHKADVKLIYQKFSRELPAYVLKLTYTDISEKNIVSPKPQDLARSKTMKNLKEKLPTLGYALALKAYQWAKEKHVKVLNSEAVLEVVGNDVSRTLGMRVQTQQLYPARFQNSVSQLLLIGTWMDGATDLGGKNCSAAAGGIANDKYLVRPVVAPEQGIQYLSDDSIPHFAQYKAPMYVQGDPDGIGSNVQNKMRIGNDFVGIDFGKVFQMNIVSCITPDMQIGDPKIKALFRNYSIFDDAPRSDMIRGIFRLARLVGDITLSPQALMSYGEDFQREILALEPKADEQVFADYINYFKDLLNEYVPNSPGYEENVTTCKNIISEVSRVRDEAIKSRNLMVEKFRHYLQLERETVDLLEHIEKVIAGPYRTTLRSSDNSVLLNHLRMTQNLVADWEVSVVNNRYTFRAKFEKPNARKEAHAALNKWLADCPELLKFFVPHDDKIEISFERNPETLRSMCAAFAEAKIIESFHPKDYALQQHFRLEQTVMALFDAFKPYGVQAKLVPPATRWSNRYEIHFEPIPDMVCEKIFFEMLSKCGLNAHSDKSVNKLSFHKNELPQVKEKLTAIVPAILHEQDIRRDLNTFSMQQAAVNGCTGKTPLNLQRNDPNFIFTVLPQDILFADVLTRRLSELRKQGDNYLIPVAQLAKLNAIIAAAVQEYTQLRAKIAEQLETCARIATKIQNCGIDISEAYGLITVKIISQDAVLNTILNLMGQNGFNLKDNSYTFSHDVFNKFNELLSMAANTYRKTMEYIEEERAGLELTISTASASLPPSTLTAQYVNEKGVFSITLCENGCDREMIRILRDKISLAVPNTQLEIPYQKLETLRHQIRKAVAEFNLYKEELARRLEQERIQRECLERKNATIKLQLECFTIFGASLHKDKKIGSTLQIQIHADANNDTIRLGFINDNCHTLFMNMLNEGLAEFRNTEGNYQFSANDDGQLASLDRFIQKLPLIYGAYLEVNQQNVEQLTANLRELHKTLTTLSTNFLDRTPAGALQTSMRYLTSFKPKLNPAEAKAIKPELDALMQAKPAYTAESLQKINELLTKRHRHIAEELKNEAYAPEIACLKSAMDSITSIAGLRTQLSPLYVEEAIEFTEPKPSLSPNT